MEKDLGEILQKPRIRWLPHRVCLSLYLLLQFFKKKKKIKNNVKYPPIKKKIYNLNIHPH